jgi:hypothetical protein
VSGSGPWNWTCNGSSGGTNAPCSAPKLNPPSGGGAGASGTCGQIRVTWTDNSQGEQGFKIYRNTTNNSATATLITPGPNFIPSTSVNTTGTSYAYIDTSPQPGFNYYWITSYAAAVESNKDQGATGSVDNASCEAKLDNSNKDIFSVNGVNSTTLDPTATMNTCSGNEYPKNVSYKAGDELQFNINLCNDAPASGGKAATSIVIEDTLINLEPALGKTANVTDPASWKASINGGLSIGSITVVSGSVPNNLKLRFTITGSLPANNAATLKLSAKVAFPDNFSGTSSRFQNSASINYTKDNFGNPGTTVNKSTPLLLFVNGSGPSKIEAAP